MCPDSTDLISLLRKNKLASDHRDLTYKTIDKLSHIEFRHIISEQI